MRGFHIGTGGQTVVFRGPGAAVVNYMETTYPGMRVIAHLVAGGALDRHPGCGCSPFLLLGAEPQQGGREQVVPLPLTVPRSSGRTAWGFGPRLSGGIGRYRPDGRKDRSGGSTAAANA